MTVRRFDLFLSHNSQDNESVRKLAEHLRNRGLSVWLDEADLTPGESWQEELEIYHRHGGREALDYALFLLRRP